MAEDTGAEQRKGVQCLAALELGAADLLEALEQGDPYEIALAVLSIKRTITSYESLNGTVETIVREHFKQEQ